MSLKVEPNLIPERRTLRLNAKEEMKAAQNNSPTPAYLKTRWGTGRALLHQIRVLDLHPGDANDAVECTIRVKSLDDTDEYEALSYVWGGLTLDHDAKISGESVLVTRNLHDGLRCLRSRTKTRTLWIDQLCINQLDNDERASQVMMMKEIYEKCSRCIIWLGTLDERNDGFGVSDAKAVFEFLVFCADKDKNAMTGELPVLFQDSKQGQSARLAWEAFSMYGNPWWTRIWTIQEAIIPHSALFVWGPFSITRDVMYDAIHNLHGNVMRSVFSHDFCAKRIELTPLLRRVLYPFRGFLHCKDGEDTLNLLMRWRHRDSTDPRDKVYALRGLVPPESIPSAIPCSYDITPADLFQQVTVDQIRRENGLRAFVGSTEMPHITPDLATWAIDFGCSNRVGKRQLKWWNHSHRYKKFQACGNQQLQLSIKDGGKTLVIPGIPIDSIAHINTIYTVSDAESMNGASLHATIVSALSLLESFKSSHPHMPHYPATSQPWNEAFFRTMLGDLVMREFPVQRVDPRHQDDFANLLHDLEATTADQDGELSWVLHFGYQRTNSGRTLSVGSEQVPKVSWSEGVGPPAAAEGRYANHPSYLGTEYDPNVLYESVCGMVPNHAFFITERGYLGVGPVDVRKGDGVWVLSGGQVPFVLREVERRDERERKRCVTLVGDAYVHGVMDGEGVGEESIWEDVYIH